METNNLVTRCKVEVKGAQYLISVQHGAPIGIQRRKPPYGTWVKFWETGRPLGPTARAAVEAMPK